MIDVFAKQILLIDRQGAFASLLRANFGETIRFDVPLVGLAFWIQFLDHEKLRRLETRARMKGFRILSSEWFRISEFAPRGLRLGFASKDPHKTTEAIANLRGFLD